MQAVFKFLIKDKVIPVQPFDKLMNISKNIRNELIFSSEHSYQIESKVRQEIIEEFIKYIIFDETPEITINNINEYETLSKEFSIFEETINKKKHEYGEYLINLNGLSSEDEGMRNIYLERITTELDEYLTRYGEEMMQIPIQTLYNIFNHSKRKLNNHNLAYEHIISYYNKTQDSNIFILLDLLDGSKLSRKNIEESYSLSTLRNNHIPKIDFSTINELFSTQRKQEQLLEEQRLKYDELLITMNKQQQKQEKKEINYKKSIETLENKIEQLINTQAEQSKLLEEQRTKYEELLILMNEKQEQYEIKYKKSSEKHEEHIKSIKQDKDILNNQINEQNSKITKLEKELKNLKATIIKTRNNCQPFITKLDKSSPGILQQLKNTKVFPFDNLFIPSLSSNDIYNIIDPNTNDRFSIIGIGKFIEIELQESISIIGIKIYSSLDYFPKSFDIEIDNEKVASIKEAKELNGENQEMTINIKPIQCQRIRIINTGQN